MRESDKNKRRIPKGGVKARAKPEVHQPREVSMRERFKIRTPKGWAKPRARPEVHQFRGVSMREKLEKLSKGRAKSNHERLLCV